MAINLQKGQRISLEKDGKGLEQICVGVNWGAIESKGMFGKVKKEAVDLDASVGMFAENKELLDKVCFEKLKSTCGSIYHSGDDLTGDVEGDDGLDNEVIVVDLTQVPENISQIAFVLNSYKGQDFASLPFASIRIYEGSPDRVDNVIAIFDIANDVSFNGKISMILGKLYRHGQAWKFSSLGDASTEANLADSLKIVAEKYL